jgi:predicted ATPase/DNA-binding SARP family transcriptional activator
VLFCRVLGPLEVEIDGAVADLGGRVPRRLLAALTTTVGKPVPDDLLAELVWGDDQPAMIVNSLRVVVSRLRTALGPARDCIDRTPNGYLLIDGQTDHRRFSELVATGIEQMADRQEAAAVGSFQAALSLWRGEPWSNLGEAVAVTAARSRLQELQLVAVEELQAALLAVGETARAVAALTEAVAEAPFRERRWELLALGLYRSGRQAHALAELRRLRQLLVTELGVEPGPRLRELERRMLDHDPDLLLVEAPGPRLDDVPAFVAAGVRRPASALFGRTADLAVLGELLQSQRLVTLLGPAGVGKSRLAVEYAASRAGETEAWLVRLADVHAAAAVPPAVAAAIGLNQLSGDATVLVRRALAGRPGLLVLDNCEHLVEAVGDLALELVAGCPQLRILTTSRQALELDGEQVMAVEPLPVDQDGPAVELLLDRARTARAGWQPTAADRESARRICTTLDGLPLAIELAATRERAFGLPEIADRLHDRVDVLGPTPRGSMSPHASLNAAIQWSIDQLDEAGRELLLRLWPFEGGFNWHAAEAVQPEQGGTLSMLAGLVGRSVVTVDRSTQPSRYRILETIRRYCAEADPDPAGSRALQAAWVHSYVAAKTTLLFGAQAGIATRELAVELPNIVAGLNHELGHGNPAVALRTAASLEWVWINQGAHAEGMRLVAAALTAASDASVADRVRGLIALAVGDFHVGDPQAAVDRLTAALDLLPDDDQRELLLITLVYLVRAAIQLGDADLAEIAMSRFWQTAALGPFADWVQASGLLAAGLLHLLCGRLTEGTAALEAGGRASRDCGYLWGSGTADLVLGWAYLGSGDSALHSDALSRLSAAAEAFEEQSNLSDLIIVLYAGAHAVADPAIAVQLHAAVAEHAERTGADPARFAQLAGSAPLERLRQLVDDPQYRSALEAGRAMSWSEMVRLFFDALG